MKIPNKLKIGAHEFTVMCQETVEDNGEAQLANIRAPEGVIRLAKKVICSETYFYNVSEPQAAEAFLHEIIHALCIQNGHGDQEKITTCLGCGLLQVIRDNDLDFRGDKDGKVD